MSSSNSPQMVEPIVQDHGQINHPFTAPSLVIDMRKNRIRIHKQTLHLLGDPDFVQLLVNPSTQTIAIRCSTSNDHLAHRIHWKTISGKQCCELYSKILMDTMSDVFLYLSPNQSYRITGKLYEKNRLAHFSLKNSVCLGTNGGE